MKEVKRVRKPNTPRENMQAIRIGEFNILATSVGGAETCIYFPEMKMCWDMGRYSKTTIPADLVCFTHTHGDHFLGSIGHAALRHQRGWTPPRYVIPREHHAPAMRWFKAWEDMGSSFSCDVIPASPGDVLATRKGWDVRAFRAVHTRPTLGYALTKTKPKVLPEYQGLQPSEYIRLKSEGVEFAAPHTDVSLAFCADTTIDVLRDPVVQAARALILECTFLDDGISPEQARQGGHIHIMDIQSVMDVLAQKEVLFTHPSQRYTAEEITQKYHEAIGHESH
jgi:ribonuclease Z